MENIIKSLKNNGKGILIMILASLFTSIGQMFWKIFRENNNILFLAIGFILYGVGAILMIVAFKFGKYSIIHPMMCTSYIFAILLGGFFLGEYLSVYKLLGIFIISVGVIFIGGGDE